MVALMHLTISVQTESKKTDYVQFDFPHGLFSEFYVNDQ